MAKKKIKKKGKQVNKTVAADNITDDAIAAAYSTPTPPLIPPVFLKVCRLCESKDGPFLNIFDVEKETAKKIDELMPFSITENDDLPHKICFRCSAKLEELYEFIQKCIKTQQNLQVVIGKSGPFITKSKMGKQLWEEKLNKSNMSNDEICNALIEKAMEGIKNKLPLLDEDQPTTTRRVTRSKETVKEIKAELKPVDEVSVRQVRPSLEKSECKPPTTTNKVMRSAKTDISQDEKIEEALQSRKTAAQAKKADVQSKKLEAKQTKKQEIQQTSRDSQNESNSVEKTKNMSLNNFSFDYDPPASTPPNRRDSQEKKEEPKKPFNIMDYISMIKVNGVGILFQCKLCNRNFLKKEVVESHNCAKNGIPKVDIPKSVLVPEPPKVSTVKYIKIDGEMKKTLTEKIRRAERSENERLAAAENVTSREESYEPPPKIKPKPKAGPASKTRRFVEDPDSCVLQSYSTPTNPAPSAPPAPPVPPMTPSVHFPAMPNLNSRFKLVPGPNNIFTLVEDASSGLPVLNSEVTAENSKKPSRKRKSEEAAKQTAPSIQPTFDHKSANAEVINIDQESKPYPVGLFQTVAHSAHIYQPSVSHSPPTFTTPAMKKQSYTIVQTGNPSKLLISTKAIAAEEESPRKRQRKSNIEVREEARPKDPYTVTIEDVAPPKDPGFFTFINVDPLLQPSYVLPTDNIIQESQISTSSAVVRPPVENKESKDKDKYNCNMCGETFSREKKLLSHIQSHYMKMDEEDQLRAEKGGKKKGRK